MREQPVGHGVHLHAAQCQHDVGQQNVQRADQQQPGVGVGIRERRAEHAGKYKAATPRIAGLNFSESMHANH